jgi:hypothetical protein
MADPTIFTWSLLDQLNLTAEVSLYVAYDGSTETTDALIGTWLATGALIDAATTSKITGGSITIPLQRDASWKSTPAAGNGNNEVIVVDFGNASNQYVTEVLLPGYKAAMVSGGKVVLTQTNLAALITNILNTTAVTAFYQSRDIQQLTAVIKAFLTNRKRRNQRLKTESRP